MPPKKRSTPRKAPKRPKAPKTHLATDATPQRLPAPKTRGTVIPDTGTDYPVTGGTATYRHILFFGNPEPWIEPPPSRWSRLRAWLGRLGRP